MRFKRLISWIITLAMILSLMPVSVFANDDAKGKLTVEYYTKDRYGFADRRVGRETVNFSSQGISISTNDLTDKPSGYSVTDKSFYWGNSYYYTTSYVDLNKFGSYYYFTSDDNSKIGKSDRYTATGTVRVYVEEQTDNQSNFYYELDPDITLGYWREGTDSSIQEVTSLSSGVQNGSIDADLFGNNCSEGIVFFVKSSSDWVQSFTRELLPGSASDQGVYIALNDANLSSYSSRWFYDKAVEAKSQGYTYFFWYSKQGSGENNWKFKISATYCPIKVLYDVNGGNGYYPSINFNYTDSNKVFNIPSNPPQPPSKEYVFTGWKLVGDSDVNRIYKPDE